MGSAQPLQGEQIWRWRVIRWRVRNNRGNIRQSRSRRRTYWKSLDEKDWLGLLCGECTPFRVFTSHIGNLGMSNSTCYYLPGLAPLASWGSITLPTERALLGVTSTSIRVGCVTWVDGVKGPELGNSWKKMKKINHCISFSLIPSHYIYLRTYA